MKLLDLFLPINRTICPVVALFAAFLACGNPAHAQSNVVINCQTGTTSTGAPIYAPASATNPCPVATTPAPGVTQDVNLTEVAGAAVATGHGTAAGALRVELPTDGTGVVGASQSGTWTVQPGNTANTTPWLVTPVPGTGSTPANIVTGQAIIAVTGTAVQLAAHSGLVNGISIKACNGPAPEHINAAVIYYGASTVTNTGAGVGNGDSIGPGERVGQGVNNSSVVWINGTAGDCVTFGGN